MNNEQRDQTEDEEDGAELDPRTMALDEWLRRNAGTRTGTFTFNGVTYTDMNEIEWRQANDVWQS